MTLLSAPPAVPAALSPLAAALGGNLITVPLAPRHAFARVLVGSGIEDALQRGGPPVLALPAGASVASIARVLFPADFAPRSEPAFQRTLELCQALAADLHLLHVYGDDRLLPDETDQARRAAVRSVRELFVLDQERLGAYAARARELGVQASAATAEGRAHDAITRYVAANAIDLIVMATHGPRSTEDILLGTTTARTVGATRVPVLVFMA